MINELFKPFVNEGELFSIVSKAHEFQQVKVSEMNPLKFSKSYFNKVVLKN